MAPKPHLQRVLPVPIELDAPAALNEHATVTDVLVGDHHVIQGDTGGGSYVVWAIRVILNGLTHSLITLYKRYSDLEKFRNELVQVFGDVPPLPPKDSISWARVALLPQWLEHRRKGVQWFLSNVLLDPKYATNSLVREFILL